MPCQGEVNFNSSWKVRTHLSSYLEVCVYGHAFQLKWSCAYMEGEVMGPTCGVIELIWQNGPLLTMLIE